MCNVYSFSGFAKVLIKNGITFSIRDFLDPKKVDILIDKLIKKTCNEQTYAGAGIARSCFIDYKSGSAIKVNKEFFTSYLDEDAIEEYKTMIYYENEPFIDGGWVINKLNEVVKSKINCCEQNYNEISTYEHFLLKNQDMLDYIPHLYAVSSNWQVEIFENCESFEWPLNTRDLQRFEFIETNFEDTHDGNLGFNHQGKLVILDFGLS